jgi:SAM-dependent methyltransferase
MFALLEAFAPLVGLALAGATAVAALVALNDGSKGGRLRPLLERWSFRPEELLGGSPRATLFLASALGLFLEMLLIRWLSSEVRIFAFYKNFVLVACFLGFGLGGYLSERRVNLLTLLAPLALLAAFVEVPRKVVSELPTLLGATSEVHVWGVPELPLQGITLAALAAGIAVSAPVFALIAFTFVPFAQIVGRLLETAPSGIAAYTLNVAASLLGILGFTLLSFADAPPLVWLAVAGALLALLVAPRPRLLASSVAGFAAVLALVATGPSARSGARWSPYQKLTLVPNVENGETVSYNLATNDTWYQNVLDLSPAFVAKHPGEFARVPIEWNPYNMPYHFHPAARSVLVLGAGMGNDVAAALRNGGERVTAVEIDPLIVALGKEHHFERPYSSGKVHVVVDDARSYVENARETFDLVLFSLLDSHTTSSHYSNVRIDNYVYTREALEAARRVLAPGGVLVVKFEVATPWIAGRLRGLLAETFGREPVVFQTDLATSVRLSTPGRMYVTGSEETIAAAIRADPRLARYIESHVPEPSVPATITTDDWPYFYQHEPGLPLSVLALSVALVLLTIWLVRRLGGAGERAPAPGAPPASPTPGALPLFFLGAGFMLLETQIVSRMALLFGTTWLVNSIVVSGLLALIVLANGAAALLPRLPLRAAYAALLVAIAVSWLVPPRARFFESAALRALVATLVLCLPVFFAGVVFIRTFAAAGYKGEALGSNLIGALAGGVLESLSFWTGLRALLVIALVLYALAAVTGQSRIVTRPEGST